MVVAQLEEQLLWIPDVRGSTPVIGEIYIEHLFVYLFFINCIEKTKLNKKRRGRPTFFKKREGDMFSPLPFKSKMALPLKQII